VTPLKPRANTRDTAIDGPKMNEGASLLKPMGSEPATRRSKLTIIAIIVGVVAAACGAVIMVGGHGHDAFVGGSHGPCGDNKMFTKQTLKEAVASKSVAGLLQSHELKGERKFETSDVITLGDYFYAICDSSWSILRVHKSLPSLSDQNSHIGNPQEGPFDGESGFEGIFHDKTSDTMYLVRESVDISGKDYAVDADDDDDGDRRRLGLPPNTDHPAYHAIFLQIAFDDGSGFGLTDTMSTDTTEYTVVEECPSEIKFDGDSKGFEGATSLRGKDGVLYVLGLCEGNYCAEGKKGQDYGHGRVVIMAKEDSGGPKGNGCYWKTIKTLEVPSEAHFKDYSAIALHQPSQSVVITSQENSQAWIGTLSGATDGEFDPTTAEFGDGKVLDFPRNNKCEVQHCNIEGIHFVEGGQSPDKAPQLLVAVSDKMKGKGKQPFTCLEKDQSFSLFAIP